jgi:putative two-component system response regulator
MLDTLLDRAGLIAALTEAVASYHSETAAHLRRVRAVTVLLAGDVGLPPQLDAAARSAATLHDVGKLGIAPEVLTRPGPLSDDEWRAVKRHSAIGAAMLRLLAPESTAVALAVRAHHERWDGSGYPDGLSEEAIPLTGRIIAVADTLDAVTHHRSYSPNALSVRDAVELVREHSGTQFDPMLVRALVGRYKREPEALSGALGDDDAGEGT